MPGHKREVKATKLHGVAKKERNEAITALRDSIQAYDPGFDDKKFGKLKAALSWSDLFQRERRSSRTPNKFSDPFVILQYLVEARADFDTLIASILYPIVYDLTDTGTITTIHKSFGPNISNLIKRTLQMEAIAPPAMEQFATDEEKQEHLLNLQLMGMYAAGEPRPILIRAADRFMKLKALITDEFVAAGTEITSPEDKIFLEETIQVIAPMAYRVGFGKVRQDLLDVAYRLRDPNAYETARDNIETLDEHTRVTDDDLRETEKIIAELITQNDSLRPDQFTVKARMKSPASAMDKSEEKKIPIHNLGDRFGFQVIISANLKDQESFSVHRLAPKERNEYLYRLGQLNMQVAGRLSIRHGRHSQANYVKTEFKKLAQIDPRPRTDPRFDDRNQDARFDDYVTFPKDSGYSAIQDTVFIRVGNKLIPFEMQVLDEIRHETNTYGARAGHVTYKTGIPGDIIQDWFAIAAAIIEEREIKPGRNHVFVFDENGKVHELRENATVVDFFKKFHETTQAPGPLQVQISNPDRFARRDAEAFYGSGTPLKNGDFIKLLYG